MAGSIQRGLVPSSPTPIQGASVATFLWSPASPPVNWGRSPFAHWAGVRYHHDTNRAAGTRFPLVFFLTLSGHLPRAPLVRSAALWPQGKVPLWANVSASWKPALCCSKVHHVPPPTAAGEPPSGGQASFLWVACAFPQCPHIISVSSVSIPWASLLVNFNAKGRFWGPSGPLSLHLPHQVPTSTLQAACLCRVPPLGTLGSPATSATWRSYALHQQRQ